MTRRNLSLTGLGLALVLGLAACNSVAEAPEAGSGVAPESAAVAPATEASATAAVAPATKASAAAPVAVKTALEATDPATVQLAAGKPQLIEFFAFW